MEVTVEGPDGARVSGARVALAVAPGGPTWQAVTDSAGRASFGPGILGTFTVAVEPPPGWALAAAGPDTVALTQVEPAASVVVPLVPAP